MWVGGVASRRRPIGDAAGFPDPVTPTLFGRHLRNGPVLLVQPVTGARLQAPGGPGERRGPVEVQDRAATHTPHPPLPPPGAGVSLAAAPPLQRGRRR
eukprot:710907-Pyramimonas_sp.AAC.1